jgi:hypothetical protein
MPTSALHLPYFSTSPISALRRNSSQIPTVLLESREECPTSEHPFSKYPWPKRPCVITSIRFDPSEPNSFIAASIAVSLLLVVEWLQCPSLTARLSQYSTKAISATYKCCKATQFSRASISSICFHLAHFYQVTLSSLSCPRFPRYFSISPMTSNPALGHVFTAKGNQYPPFLPCKCCISVRESSKSSTA